MIMVLIGLAIGWSLGSLLDSVIQKPKAKVPVAPKVEQFPIEIDSVTEPAIKEIYVTDSINDENSSVVTESLNAKSYWFVKYETEPAEGSGLRGWTILELQTPYFDVVPVVHQILPTYKHEDFVDIIFFKRVPYQTYLSYKNTQW